MMIMERERLYMIAIMPPPDLSRRIVTIKKEFAEAYHCKAALKAPVHITLYPPYNEVDDHESEARKVLLKWVCQQPNFELKVKGFDAFKSNGVVFLNLEKNEKLKQVHKGLTRQMTNLLQPDLKNNQTYHPHITIGYRDIPKEVFPQAVNDFLPRKFEATFKVEEIYFWRHNGKNWETIASFPLMKTEKSETQATLF
jgi:2'-5' RNA ligase